MRLSQKTQEEEEEEEVMCQMWWFMPIILALVGGGRRVAMSSRQPGLQRKTLSSFSKNQMYYLVYYIPVYLYIKCICPQRLSGPVGKVYF